MNDDHTGRIDDELPESIERSSRQWIDEVETIRRRNLHQTQARMVGILADKLCIEAETGTFRQLSTTGLQVFRMRNDLFPHLLLLPASSFGPFAVGILSIADAPAAVNRQHDAGDEVRGVATQENSRVAAILRLAWPGGQRLLGPQVMANGRIVHGASRHRRF